MSLSTQYLEELSRRYKKQVEEMQRAFNKTLAAIGESEKKGQERELKQAEEMEALRNQVVVLSNAITVLLQEREGWTYKLGVSNQHILGVLIGSI